MYSPGESTVVPSPLMRSIVFERPARLVAPAAWQEHIPFAFWLADVQRPRTFVELGTYAGNSYCAFLQAIKQLKLSSQCYAVDTWAGDEHASFYGPEVYEELSLYHDARYGSFSRLVRSTFDEATVHFAEGSIDLLHIDGLHTYEAVRHDFDTWLPKLRRPAVILFHDINVREQRFGVWRLWEELSHDHQSFSFLHGNGLGVLGVGDTFANDLDWLFATSRDRQLTEIVRSFFAQLGSSFTGSLALEDLANRRDDLTQQRDDLTQQRDDLTQQRDDLTQQRDDLTQQRDDLTQQRDDLTQQRDDLTQQLEQASSALDDAIGQLAQTRAELRKAEEDLRRLRYIKRAGRVLGKALRAFGAGQLPKGRNDPRDKARVAKSGLFSGEWYLRQYPDIVSAGIDPLDHFLSHGGVEGRDPSSEFSSARYLAENADVAAAKQNPLVHYLTYGAAEGRATWGAGRRVRRADGETSVLIEDPSQPIDPTNPAETEWVRQLLGVVAAHGDAHLAAWNFAAEPKIIKLIDATRRLAGRQAGHETCDVSIIIPVHNKLMHTLCCLNAILSAGSRYTMELVVADDSSNDATASIIELLGGPVRLLRSESNCGFLQNCNRAAAQARGRALVLLNNDTIVLPNWLDPLLEQLFSDDTIGLVGSKLLNSDGTLQEAGGVIWNDGTGWNFGRGQAADAPQYNYLRPVDYISGAAIALLKSVWDSLGGFDPIYTPAYYEDVDLAFRVRAAGRKVLYQPLSQVIHHEGVSHGRNTAGGIKSYQVRNRTRFLQRWNAVLEREHFRPGMRGAVACNRSSDRPSILIVDHQVPEPDHDSGSRAMFDYIKLFVEAGFHVVFWPHDLQHRGLYTTALQSIGVEVIYRHGGREPAFEDWLRENGDELAYALLSRPDVASAFIDRIKERTRARILFFGVDIHFHRLKREFATTGSRKAQVEADRMEHTELDVWKKSDVIFYYSDEERDFVRSVYPDKRAIAIPIFLFDEERLKETRERIRSEQRQASKLILYVGGFRHPPNSDAVLWFVEKVWPLVLRTVPDAKFCVVGSHPPAEILALKGPSISVTGFISDAMLHLLYTMVDVTIVPLRYGAGVKGKVLEAISFGVPVVTTSTGTQGIPCGAEIVEICDEPARMANVITKIVQDPQMSSSKQLAGLDYLGRSLSRRVAIELIARDVPELQRCITVAEPPHSPAAGDRDSALSS